jgi:uncharacterized protein
MNMSIQSIPKLLKPQTLARDNQALVGTLPLSVFPRLAEHLASPEGDIHVDMKFSSHTKNQVSVDLRVNGDIPLICQRCLEPYLQPIAGEARLSPIHEEDEGENIPEGTDPVLLEQGNLNVYSMIEDEILLSLPTIPCHPLSECPARDKVITDEQEIKNRSITTGQFAILSNLKKNPS